ncbi:MAG: OmpH family outer membrane protein [Alphaproteobacteria bacterium]|nr:OmpH family outer membrane protein [Alphaproteobacteria bacterium]
MQSLILRLLFLVALFSFCTPSARAETSFAIVDVQRALTESVAARNIQDQVKSYRAKFLEEISREEQSLREQEKKIADESASLSKEDLQKKKQDFETKFMETSRMAQNRKKNLDAALAKAMTQLRDKFFGIVQTLADEKGYTMVISRQAVVVTRASTDITEESMKRLDQAISKIPLEVSE